MKQILIVFLFLMNLIFSGCNRQRVLITVELPDQPDVDLFYSEPIMGTIFLGFRDTLRANGTGKFEINLKIAQPSFISIWESSFQNNVKLLVEPGNSYHVLMGLPKNIQITGANAKGQMLYATFPDDQGYIEIELRKLVNIYNDTIPFNTIHQQMNDLKESELSKFNDLLINKEISKPFFDLIQKDRDCYYTSLEAKFSIIKTYRKAFRTDDKINDDLLSNLKKIYDQYPPYSENSLFSSFWYEFARDYIIEYKQLTQSDFDVQKTQDLKKSGTYNTFVINESKKYLNGKALEFFRARYIHNLCFQGSFEKELISLFEQFESDYLKSDYSKYLKPFINEIKKYHKIIEQPFDPAMLFMDKYETINTLEDALKPLQGKKIYIDVWATWCGPCKREFEHNEALKKILAENDIQQLYISLDTDEAEQAWKEMIKFYHLTGSHIRANKEFRDNLVKQYNFIPWYILVDESGKIIEKHAKSPSQLVAGEKLW